MRRQLVKEVASKGIQSSKVLDAIGKIPRHFFFDKIFDTHAYEDKAFPIGEGQTISQPYTVAFQTQLLDIQPGDKILEIGTGSGYQATVLLELGAKVHTIEYQPKLYEKTRVFLPKLGYKAHFYQGDGSKGLADKAPYNGIIVTAGAPTVPEELIKQLDEGLVVDQIILSDVRIGSFDPHYQSLNKLVSGNLDPCQQRRLQHGRVR